MTIEAVTAVTATSNVIELKAGHTYLLVFNRDVLPYTDIMQINDALKKAGVTPLIMMLPKEADLKVGEVPPTNVSERSL